MMDHACYFSTKANQITIHIDAPIKPLRLFHITDTHLSLDDARGLPYEQYSQRMAEAYQRCHHFQTGVESTPAEHFTQTLDLAKAENADFLALTGDMFSFPSEVAVEWTYEQLQDCGIPWGYIAGNHDWHYEGVPGSDAQQRQEWVPRRLARMYQGDNQLFAAYDVNGVRLVFIDNSTYEILPEQLTFFREHVASNVPMIVFMHIPLYVPGRPVGFGCGHPDWCAANDSGWEVERRESWREEGHTGVTLDFHREVFEASNLLLVMAGHMHQPTLDVVHGIPQVVTSLNATGYFSDVRVVPLG